MLAGQEATDPSKLLGGIFHTAAVQTPTCRLLAFGLDKLASGASRDLVLGVNERRCCAAFSFGCEIPVVKYSPFIKESRCSCPQIL